VTALDRELARALVAAIRDDPELRDELRGLLVDTTAEGTPAPKWLTVAQAAERLACTPDAVRMRCSRGRLEHRRQGRRLYVSAESVDRLA
jgi:excisionase family DNA binding protein